LTRRSGNKQSTFPFSLANFYPYLLYLVFSFAAFSPCLLTGKAFFANDLLYFHGPMRMFLRDQLIDGRFPLWNPYMFCGQPFFADPNNMMAYPLSYLTLFLPLSWDLTLFFCLHMFLAACGMHFWLRSLGLALEKCRVGSLLYSLSGFFWVELIHPSVLAAFACLPWVFGCLERLSKDLENGKAFAAGFSFAILFLAGFFQITLGGFYGGLLYFLIRIKPQNFGGSSWGALLGSSGFLRKLFAAFLFMFWGAMPLLVQLVPTAEFANFSTRNSGMNHYENFNSLFSMQPKSVYQFLFPTMDLAPGETLEKAIQTIRNIADVDYLGNAGYLGVWIPLLLLLAFRQRGKTIIFFLSSLALLSLMVGFGKYFFVHRLFCALLPGFGILRAPYRFIYLYVLCVAVLASWGCEELERIILYPKRNPFLSKAVPIYGFCLILISMAGWKNFGNGVWRDTMSAFVGLTGIYLGSQKGGWGKKGRVLFQTALILPLLFYGWSLWTAGDGENYDFAGNSVATKLPPIHPGRLMMDPSVPYFLRMNGQTFATNFPDNALTALGIRSIGGYNPLRLEKTEELSNLTFSSKRRLMAVGEILSGKTVKDTGGMRHEIHGEFHFYITPSPPDYLFTPALVKTIPMPTDQLRFLKDGHFDPREQAVLDRPLPREIASRPPSAATGLHYDLGVDTPDRQSFNVHLDIPSLVVFSEVNYPGWKAFIDGQPADLLTADYAFRALFVPAGNHEVEFKYRPSWAQPLLWLLVLWSISAILYGSFLWVSKRKAAFAHPPESKTGP
jgi:hypothetical protein